MKKIILTMTIITFTGLSLISCKDEAKKEGAEENAIETTIEEIVKTEYQCPMKCEGDKTYTDKDVKCPMCGGFKRN